MNLFQKTLTITIRKEILSSARMDENKEEKGLAFAGQWWRLFLAAGPAHKMIFLSPSPACLLQFAFISP